MCFQKLNLCKSELKIKGDTDDYFWGYSVLYIRKGDRFFSAISLETLAVAWIQQCDQF